MQEKITREDRLVLPIWRDYKQTVRSKELSSAIKGGEKKPDTSIQLG